MKSFPNQLLLILSICTVFYSCNDLSSKELLTNKLKQTEWKLIGGISNCGEEIILEKDEEYTLTFKDDKTISGIADCNSYSGEYLLDFNQLEVDSLISTEMECGKNSWISNYYTALDEVGTYQIVEGKLTMFNGESGYLIFRTK